MLESFVTKMRDKKVALKLLEKTLKQRGRPLKILTDRLCSYGEASPAADANGEEVRIRSRPGT